MSYGEMVVMAYLVTFLDTPLAFLLGQYVTDDQHSIFRIILLMGKWIWP